MTSTRGFYGYIRGTNKSLLVKPSKKSVNYTGSKGYNLAYGRYVGSIAVMMVYLKHQNFSQYLVYDHLLRYHSKPSRRMGESQLKATRRKIWELLDPETQRKFCTRGFIHE